MALAMQRSFPADSNVTSGPWAEIDLRAVCENFAMLRTAAPGAQTAAVVKCDGYGLGMAPVARALCEQENCRSFFVAYPEEGAALREALKDLAPDALIYVFSGPAPETIKLFEEAGLAPVINSPEQAKLWAAHRKDAPCALHFETGINRLGMSTTELEEVMARGDINVALLMSHLACGADPSHPMNSEQRQRCQRAAKNYPNAKLSLAASAGVLMDPSFHFDLTRPGIALYGGSPFDVDDARIKPAVTLKAPIMQLRSLEPGECVGYGATFVADKPTTIAVAGIGYGDGVPVTGSGKIHAAIDGARVPIAGRVSMDLTCFDVTALGEKAQAGAAIEIFGPSVSVFDMAAACGTSCYELLTRLGGRVDRRYV